jgi:hypothetical protein
MRQLARIRSNIFFVKYLAFQKGVATIDVNDNTFTEINKRIYTIEDNLHLTISDYNADLEFFGITSHSTSEAIKLSD